MLRCSTAQVLDVWMDLEDALRGENGFGGNTAEIYSYRLTEHRPSLTASGAIGDEARSEAAAIASKNLKAILEHFTEYRHASIWVDGVQLKKWGCAPNDHRWHVRVEENK
jgi:hypothetical protein